MNDVVLRCLRASPLKQAPGVTVCYQRLKAKKEARQLLRRLLLADLCQPCLAGATPQKATLVQSAKPPHQDPVTSTLPALLAPLAALHLFLAALCPRCPAGATPQKAMFVQASTPAEASPIIVNAPSSLVCVAHGGCPTCLPCRLLPLTSPEAITTQSGPAAAILPLILCPVHPVYTPSTTCCPASDSCSPACPVCPAACCPRTSPEAMIAQSSAAAAFFPLTLCPVHPV